MMNRTVRWLRWTAGLLLAGAVCLTGFAQEKVKPSAGAEAKPSAPAAAKPPYRQLAPGVMHSVDAAVELEETFSRHDLVEMLAVDPKYDWAKDVTFRRDVWHLDFQFKPLRYIWVDVPQPSGKMERKLIRYLIYSVTNPGKAIRPIRMDDGKYKAQYVDLPVRFIPQFLLEIPKLGKVYPDRVIPVALGPIRMREDPDRRLYTTVEMCREIAVGEVFWGVATWEDVDPRLTRFSIYVQGLTNAYKWQDEPGKYKPGDPVGTGRRLSRKTLKLNFWRPGDEFYEHEAEVRYGAPGELDYEWVYR